MFLPRFFSLPAQEKNHHRFTLSEDIIKVNAHKLFAGYKVLRTYAFRITRNADIELAEDEADDLLQVIEDEVRKRRWGDAVRLEVIHNMPREWQSYLRETLNLEPEDIYRVDGYLNLGAFIELANLDIPQLRYSTFSSRLPSEFRGTQDVFEAIAKQDILIHHPFHAFDAVLNLIEQAASDPNVLAIKQTLYRVGSNSPVVRELARAAGNGKHVTALVELKARFDEENNIVWARELESSGVDVVYGFCRTKNSLQGFINCTS